jgi:hypothetical protein
VGQAKNVVVMRATREIGHHSEGIAGTVEASERHDTAFIICAVNPGEAGRIAIEFEEHGQVRIQAVEISQEHADSSVKRLVAHPPIESTLA